MPALGMAQETGKLVRWLKGEGSEVAKGEPLMEVETDKATVEVESPAAGTLASLSAQEGEDVAVGRTIAWIVGPGESAPAPGKRVAEPAPARSQAAERVTELRVAAPPPASGRAAASPKARRLAAERGVDLSTITGSGPGGAIVEDDILQAGPAAPAAPSEPALWRAMAENVSRSWREAPHFFVIREIDASGLVEQRGREGSHVTFTDLLVKHVAGALAQHRRMNTSRDEINIGLAVALPEGLIVPVIHGADRLTVTEIASRRREVVDHVRSGHVRSAELTGGTFTVSNLGMYGVDLFTAVLTEGQAGILAVGRIADRVVAHEGRPQVRPTMLMSLSCDHRRVDGARAAEFMQTLAATLETGAGS